MKLERKGAEGAADGWTEKMSLKAYGLGYDFISHDANARRAPKFIAPKFIFVKSFALN